MSDILIRTGSLCSLWWVAGSSGRFRAKEYFDSLKDPERAKFAVLFERMASTGTIHNEEHFRKESDNIYCFKRGQHRLACFRQGRDFMLVHGFRKKSDKDKRLKRHIETAERLRTEYLDPNVRNRR
jgi:Phage derived protein Gp49-like (DUF891)